MTSTLLCSLSQFHKLKIKRNRNDRLTFAAPPVAGSWCAREYFGRSESLRLRC